jgi:hypothetical protein
MASLLAVLGTGCTNTADAAHQAAQSSTAARPVTHVWHGFAPGCPTLTAAPYGLAAQGKRAATGAAPGEQQYLDKVVPGAVIERTACHYWAAAGGLPAVETTIMIFGGNAGATQTDAWFQSQRSAASRVGGSADYTDVPGIADGAFALYSDISLRLTARSGDAYVTVNVLPGEEISRTFDKLQPLRQQVPALTAVMTDTLTGLR